MGRPAARNLRLMGVVLAAAALLLPTVAQAKKKPVVGHVYTQTNSLTSNRVVIFNRYKNGSLVKAGSVKTNGTGAKSPDCSPPGPVICPFNDSNGSLRLSPDGRLLFVTNGGSNTIATFLVKKNGLKLASVTPSGGGFPLSTTMHGNVLYVLNYTTGNIKGFTVKNNGHLKAIKGATQSVSTPGAGGHVGQIGFDPSGHTLIVSERGPSIVDTFVVKNGVAGPAKAHAGGFPGSYGFDITSSGHVLMSDGGAPPFITGAITSWALHPNGGLSMIETTGADPSDPNNANPPNHGAGSCWTVITPDGKYAYVTNSTAKTISRVKLDANGHFTVLGVTAIPNSEFAMLTNIPADEGFSPNGKVLYVTVPSLYAGNTGRVDAWAVHGNGGLSLIGSTPSTLPAGAGSGIAVN
jgi:6-phosphogluconolactonase